MATKAEIIQSLERLTQEPGFIYSLAVVLLHDLFLNPEESADINWHERISFQEASFLVGLMVKSKINLSEIPTEDELNKIIINIYKYLRELHKAYSLPLFERIIRGSKKKLSKDEADREYKDIFGSGEWMVEPIFYGESGAYDFQYWEFAPKKYQMDGGWIQKNVGISIENMISVSVRLKRLLEEKRRTSPMPKNTEEICRMAFSIFCFSYEDLNDIDKDVLGKFIGAFSVTPGEVNQKYDMVGAYNAVDSHPIIKLNSNLFFLPIGFNLAQSIYESPFYWMCADASYNIAASNNRGEATEKIAYELTEKVFGIGNVFKDVKVFKNKKELITDIDILALAGNKAVIVQAKSKKLTELAKRGNDDQLKADFKVAVQKAYDQSMMCRAAIIDQSNLLVTEDGKELHLKELIDDAYLICLTSEHYPAVIHQVDVYLQKGSADPYPLAMSIFDLDILCFYLKDPFDFLYYLRQRTNLSNYFKADSEIALLGLHLRYKLLPRPNVGKEIVAAEFAQLVDANFPAMKGHCPITGAVEKLHHTWKNDAFQELIEQVKKSGEPGLTDAILFLYDLTGEIADDLVRMIEVTKKRTMQDKDDHDFSMILEKGKSGVSFLSILGSLEKLKRKLVSLAAARKYRTKANEWLALGVIADSPSIVDGVIYNKKPWQADKELEEYANKILKQGTVIIPKKKKTGRNKPCYCGSGLKYKKCCGK